MLSVRRCLDADESEPPEPRVIHYKNTFPGARFPHAWLNAIIPTTLTSTIDLTEHNYATNFTGIGGK